MKNPHSLETRLGLFVSLILLATFFVLVIAGGMDKFQRGIHLHALFSSAQELKVGDRVKLAGVEIGKVEKIGADYASNKVKVTMKIRSKIDGVPVVIKSDSVAKIKFAGMMGQSFVSLDFGSPTNTIALTDGMDVKADEQPDVGAVMEQLSEVAKGIKDVTKVFAGDSMNNLFATLSDFMKRNSDDLTLSISNLSWASFQIREGKGTLGKLFTDDSLYTTAVTTLTNLQSSFGSFQAIGDDVKATLAEARKVIDGINAGQGSLGKLVKDEKLYNDGAAAMTNLKEILEKMNRGDGTVGKLINDQEFYKNAKVTLQKIDKATEGLEDQGPLSVIGILANSLF